MPARASPIAVIAAQVGARLRRHAREVVVVAEVDDAVGGRGAGAQAVEVVEVAAAHLGAERGDRRGGGVGAGEADDLVAGGEQLGDDGGADPARTLR